MKTLFYLFVTLVVLSSCKPERVLNKQLDGEWTMTVYDGQAVPANYSETVKFSKKGSGGDVITTLTIDGQTSIANGTYSLMKSSTITFAYPTGLSTGYPYNTAVFDINEHSKTTFKITNQEDGKVFVYTKK